MARSQAFLVLSLPKNKLAVLALGTFGVGLTGFADFITGYEIRLFPLYFLPVAWVASGHSRAAALVLSVLSALIWAASNLGAGRQYSSAYVWPINVISQFVAFATVATLVSQLRGRLNLERELSRVDVLTGLPTRRAFHERGEVLLALARRSTRPVTLAFLDLDNFKHVNDQRGHAEGDRALCTTAEILKAHFRASDVIARLGGDEFVALLYDTDREGAATTLERMRVRIAETMTKQGWPISASIGAMTFEHAPESLEQALSQADELMYRAKQGGKNRVHLERISRKPETSLAPVK